MLRVETSGDSDYPRNVAPCELTHFGHLAREQARRLFYLSAQPHRVASAQTELRPTRAASLPAAGLPAADSTGRGEAPVRAADPTSDDGPGGLASRSWGETVPTCFLIILALRVGRRWSTRLIGSA